MGQFHTFLVLALTFFLCGSQIAYAQSSKAKGFGSFKLEKANVRHATQRVKFSNGDKAERFKLRAGDCSKRNKDCLRDRERVEFLASGKQQPLGVDVWVGWSVLIPEDFPRQGEKMNVKLGQFHQLGGSGPELLFQLDDDSYAVALNDPSKLDSDPMRPSNGFQITKLVSNKSMRGRWTRIVVNARWSRDNDGIVSVWVDGKKALSHSGPNTNDTDKIYFRYGLYRSFVSRCGGPCPTLVAYFKDVRRGKSFDDVK